MEVLRCHSHQTSHIIGTKTTTSVEADIDMYDQYYLHLHYDSVTEKNFYFFNNFYTLCPHANQPN